VSGGRAKTNGPHASAASDGNPLGPVALTTGQATLTTSALSAGDHTIVATYTGAANFLASDATLTQTLNNPTTTTPPLNGLADPSLHPVMDALSDAIRDSNDNKIIGLDPSCAMTGPYQGLSDIDKLSQSMQADDGCLQFVTSYDSPPAGP